jgi:uncharacterized protein DUF3352
MRRARRTRPVRALRNMRRARRTRPVRASRNMRRARRTRPVRALRWQAMRNVRALALLLVLALVGAVAAGCGSSSGGSDSQDPAALVPANAPLYAEATVRPGDKERADVEAVLKKILRTDDPVGKLRGQFDAAARKDDVSFSKDIDPWLGDKVGVAITAFTGGNAAAVVIAASKDDDKARATLAKAKGDFVDRSYRGVDYRFDRKDKSAAAVIDHRFVAGTEAGLKAAIDASKGDALASANALEAARSKVAEDRVGFLYVDVQGFLRAASQASGSDPQVGAVLQSFSAALPKTVAAALQVDPDAIRVDAVSIGTPNHGSGASGADVVTTLPGDAWLAIGVADVGKAIDRGLQSVSGAGGLSGVGMQALLGQIQQATGLDLRKDLLSWMGDAGVFVSGTSSSTLGGGLVVKTTDPAKTRNAIAALERLARQQGGDAQVTSLQASGVDDGFTIHSAGGPPVRVALAGDRFVIAAGSEQALAQAVRPTQTLGSAAAFTAAAGKLGGGVRPSFFVDLHQVTGLIGSFAGASADFQKAKPYLDAFGAIVAGAKDEGDGVSRARILVTVP